MWSCSLPAVLSNVLKSCSSPCVPLEGDKCLFKGPIQTTAPLTFISFLLVFRCSVYGVYKYKSKVSFDFCPLNDTCHFIAFLFPSNGKRYRLRAEHIWCNICQYRESSIKQHIANPYFYHFYYVFDISHIKNIL